MTPYPAITHAALRNQDQFIYPAPAALAMAPLALMPIGVAATIFIALNIAAVIGSLRLIGVRDWRCHALTFCSIATLQSVVLGTVTPLLMLGAALAWRYRGRWLISAGSVAALVVVKLFLAPLAVWLWITGRRQAALVSAGIAAVLTVAGWAAIGFHGFASYPRLLSTVSDMEQQKGFSLVALTSALGLGTGPGRVLALVIPAALCVVAWRLRTSEGGDRKAFSLMVVAGLALSPIIWLNYFMLLLLPLGLRRPTLSPMWLVVLTPWIFANPNDFAPVWKIAAFAAVSALVLADAVGDRWNGSSAERPHDLERLDAAELERPQVDPLAA